jgi:hypothetical protein
LLIKLNIMKNLELNEMINIHGSGFWDGFCSGMMGASAGVAVAVAVGTVIPGANIILAVSAIGCFAASIN